MDLHDGTVKNNGDKNNDRRNKTPTVTDVKPVLPPSVIPYRDNIRLIPQ